VTLLSSRDLDAASDGEPALAGAKFPASAVAAAIAAAAMRLNISGEGKDVCKRR
jgi:hypothetical protein